ncbi:dipeptidyl aminopeptidase/acylaminoacyl peptidase [Saccharothrix tamanrassetensis]|uniref:Dipeptidyl aminopeptidase/acylaminoacyl peptidase n=1 Tax=Saccharothrix tamanrassetensis TaxID=1051531 RepID=A0A841CR78_9PSEU|nr:S9 family peptidase [Saccharothrix tamanrassetensis]MBB5958648.1 dipeptidyl aminopeptidase/acylaminoacyl peptidase [Saccharothrix tamanrassetensis]
MTDATRAHVVEDLTRLRLPTDPSISPDGSRVAYALKEVDGDENVQSLWWVDRSGATRRLTRGRADSAPRFSPDGRTIAFLRSGQVWLLPVDGGEPEQVTDLPLGAGVPVWSPDGGRIAFAALVDGNPDGAPVSTTRRLHKLDGLGRLGGTGSQLFVLDLADRSVTRVTSGPAFAGSPAWSPDGTRLAFADALGLAADESGDSPAYVLDLATSEVERVGAGVVGAVSWTDELILVGTPEDGVFNAGMVRGGKPVAADLDRNVMTGGGGYPGALPQAVGSTLLFCARDNGCTHLYAVDGQGATRKLIGGDRLVSGLSTTRDAAAVVLSTVDAFGEIAFLDPVTGEPTVVTSYAADFADVRHAKPEARTFTISDGVEVHGWVLRDPDAPVPAPLLVDVHGGPHNAWSPVRDPIHLYHQVLVAQGWTVLLLNPRGSDGYGEKFLRAALGGWGEADADDFLEPVDALVSEGIADRDRLALTGYSYGGFMSCRLPTRTNRFAAVVAGGVVSDLVSISGTSDVGELLGRQEIGPVERRRALSPLTHVDAVTSPTLVLHGGADERCPVGQAEQWFGALLDHDVPAELVVYPGASHLFILDGKPSHRLDYHRRTVDWLVRHTGKRHANDHS